MDAAVLKALLVPFMLSLVIAAQGCSTGDYVLRSSGKTTPLPPRPVDDPDKYKVDPSNYPRFVIKSAISPPAPLGDPSQLHPESAQTRMRVPMTQILQSDTWRVTHVVRDRYIIFSQTYQDRQCAAYRATGKSYGATSKSLNGSCVSQYLYSLYIQPDGRVDAWIMLFNPERVIFASDRHVNMDFSAHQDSAWPAEPIFRALQ